MAIDTWHRSDICVSRFWQNVRHFVMDVVHKRIRQNVHICVKLNTANQALYLSRSSTLSNAAGNNEPRCYVSKQSAVDYKRLVAYRVSDSNGNYCLPWIHLMCIAFQTQCAARLAQIRYIDHHGSGLMKRHGRILKFVRSLILLLMTTVYYNAVESNK